MALRWLTAGESHGPALVGILAGLPSGLEVSSERINAELFRRQQGIGRSPRQQIESDTIRILAGIRHGSTIGSPIAIMIENRDHANWVDEMSPQPIESPAKTQRTAYPRPGHAGLAGMLKWGLDDARNVIERASGRSTAMTVALGAVCRQYLEHFGTYIGSRILEFGPVALVDDEHIEPPTRIEIGDDPSGLLEWQEISGNQYSEIEEAVEKARDEGETLGGSVQAIAAHVPPGLGSCALPDERLDARLAAAVMGIPGIKAVEIGSGIEQAYMGGKAAHDEYAVADASFQSPWFARTSNLAGGLEGGITNGEPVCLTAWMKPLATIRPPHMSVHRGMKGPIMPEASERSDVAAVESVACVVEAVVALEIARAHRDKFGGDSMKEVEEAVSRFFESIG